MGYYFTCLGPMCLRETPLLCHTTNELGIVRELSGQPRQLFVSWSMPLLVFVWLLVLLADEAHLRSSSMQQQQQQGRADGARNAQDFQVRGGVFEAFLNLNQAASGTAFDVAVTQ